MVTTDYGIVVADSRRQTWNEINVHPSYDNPTRYPVMSRRLPVTPSFHCYAIIDITDLYL
jgi:hypothetical protein